MADIKKIYNSLEPIEKDELYRMLWKDFVKEDVISRCNDLGLKITEEAIDEVSHRYVYEGDYDCNTDYWSNLDTLIEDVCTSLDRKYSL